MVLQLRVVASTANCFWTTAFGLVRRLIRRSALREVGSRAEVEARFAKLAAALPHSQDITARQRLLAIRLAASGQLTAAQIAEQIGISRRQFFHWVNALKAGGVEKLLRRDHGGQPAQVQGTVLTELRDAARLAPHRPVSDEVRMGLSAQCAGGRWGECGGVSLPAGCEPGVERYVSRGHLR